LWLAHRDTIKGKLWEGRRGGKERNAFVVDCAQHNETTIFKVLACSIGMPLLKVGKTKYSIS
jgi:hypothetical protein